MKKDRAVNLANALVMNKEAKDLNSHVREFDKLTAEKREMEAQYELNHIIKEKRRMTGHFDHEEYWKRTGKYVINPQ